MKSEPLKDKGFAIKDVVDVIVSSLKNSDIDFRFSKKQLDAYAECHKDRAFEMEEIKSAVEWFKKRVEDHSPMFRWTKEEIDELIDKAFEDIK